MKSKQLFPILLSAFVFTGCSLDIDDSRPQDVKTISKSDRTWLQHLARLKQINSYSVTGQLGYISSTERFSSRFEWQYQNTQDRKSTRLNSSHANISYAVFCLKKKKKHQ